MGTLLSETTKPGPHIHSDMQRLNGWETVSSEIVWHDVPYGNFHRAISNILSASAKRTISIEGLYHNSQAVARLRKTAYAYLFIDAPYTKDKRRHHLRFTRS